MGETMATQFHNTIPLGHVDWPPDLATAVRLAKASVVPVTATVTAVDGGVERQFTVTRVGVGPVRNDFGRFTLAAFDVDDSWIRYYALIKGDTDDRGWPVFRNPEIPVRIDSGCLTGQVFGDQTCDCGQQLHLAMQKIAVAGEGIIVNIPGQDGRGLGLATKLAALRMFDELGADTCAATAILTADGAIEGRTYGGAIAVLKTLGLSDANRIVVLSNNPSKLNAFVENGLDCAQEPVKTPATAMTAAHFKAKERMLGHTGLASELRN